MLLGKSDFARTGEYEQSRLYQKSSKIAVFWLPASLASRFQVKTRRANALIYEYKTVAEQSISLKTRRKTEFKHNHLWLGRVAPSSARYARHLSRFNGRAYTRKGKTCGPDIILVWHTDNAAYE